MKGQRDTESDLEEVRGLTEKVALEQSPEGGEGPVAARGKSMAGRGHSQGKALEADRA